MDTVEVKMLILKDNILDSLKYIETNINESITAEDIAKHSGYSLYYFSRVFKEYVGLSILQQLHKGFYK